MADISILQLPPATSVSANDVTVVVQNGVTKKVAASVFQSGIVGPQGPAGPQGPQGVPGLPGTPGAVGPQGPGGPQGTPGAQGAPGAVGPTGPVGPVGPAGATGTAATISVGTTTTGTPGTSAIVTNAGTVNNAIFNFVIPRGDTGLTGATGATGAQGVPGTAATINVGSTTTLTPGSSATVANVGTSNAAIFNFGIPQGATGATGAAATIAVGTTTTLAPGSSATVSNSGTSGAAVFNFGIPKGAGVQAGGTTGQFLAKASNADYDTQWLTLTGNLTYAGAWNANTNTPTLVSSVGVSGTYYVVSVAGTTNLNGITDWQVGDWAIFNGTFWQKIDQTNTVTSVNGQVGTVVLGASDVGALSNVTSTDGSVTITSPTTTTRDLSVATAASTTNVLCQVRNTTGATLTKGTVVYISGATGQIPTVSKALATSDATSAQTLGMMTADLANNANGFVTVIGLITNIDTSAYTDGQQLYLSGTTAGTVTNVKPYAPIHLVYVAVVEYAHPTQGKLFVKVQNGYELDEIHNVSAQTPSNGQTIVYNSSTGLWTQNTVSLSIGVNGTLPVANGGTGVTTSTGSGSVVLSTSPTLVTPALGTPTSGNFSTGTFTWPTFNQNTTGTASGLSTTLVTSSGGTGQTTYTDGQLLIGNSTGNTLTKATLTAGSGISITNGSGSITIAATNAGAVTSVTGTSPVVSSGGATPAISLATAYGDTLNPYASKTANYVLAAPNGAAGVPTFRAIVAADIPTLNQNTTGTAANVTGVVALANGGSGQTTAQAAMNTFAGAVTSGSYLRGNGTNVVMSTIQAADVPTLNQNTTGTAANITATSNATLTTLSALSLPGSQVTGNISGNAANVTGIVAIANGGTNSTATPTAGGAGYGTGTAHAYTAAGTAGQVLTSAGAGAPTWSGISGGTF